MVLCLQCLQTAIGRCSTTETRRVLGPPRDPRDKAKQGEQQMTIQKRPESRRLGLRSGRFRVFRAIAALVAAAILLPFAVASAFDFDPVFLPAQGSTSPANGDLNPYGLA